jgi:RND family efflux transporter MFP subunit
LDALKTVDIRARVSGFVLSAPFKEGDLVHEGDLLFQIDPQSYRADADLAAANLKLAKADSNLQQKNAQRARVMMGSRGIAQEDYDTAIAAWEKSKASVEAMNATYERTKLYLDWTKVTAPLSGRISRRLVDPGNLVNADQTILTTIVSDSQLYAYFDVDERTYLNLVGPVSSGQAAWLSALQFPVLMRLANQDQFSFSGLVNFVDNRVNANTGTIRMRAVFENSGTLRAGLFVGIRLPIGTPYQAILIPAEAILSDQGRYYLYTIDNNDQVVYRPVTVGQETHKLKVIKEGLAKGERVIVSGMQRVKAGSRVHATMQDPPRPTGSPLGKLLTSAKPRAENSKFQIPNSKFQMPNSKSQVQSE